MIDSDILPPEFPTPGQQFDALKKGLGRAVRWATAGKLDRDLLRDACLHDYRYDWQLEPVRSPWLWELIRACDATDRLRGPILEGFAGLTEESAAQLCGLARHFTAGGDVEFRTRLYAVVREKPFPAMDWLGEEEVVALDGERGFEFVAGLRGERLDQEPWDWTHTALMKDAIERWGREHVVRLLAASSVPGTQSFLAAWPGEPTGPATHSDAYRDRMRAIPVADILAAASAADRCIWLRGWGRHADAADLDSVLRAVHAESDPHRLARLLRVFTGRALPVFDERLLGLARHADPAVRDVAVRVLEANTHAGIRDLGLEMLADPDRAADGVALFINNSAAGDDARIRDAVSAVPDDDLHAALMNARMVLDANDRLALLPLGLFVYRYTPCGLCRETIANLLHRRGVMPAWVREELRFDACPDARTLAEMGGI